MTPCLNARRKQVRGEVHTALCCSSRYALRNFQHSSKEISNRWIAESRTIGSFGRARASSRRVTARAKSARSDWDFVTTRCAVARLRGMYQPPAGSRRYRSCRGSGPLRFHHVLRQASDAAQEPVPRYRCRCPSARPPTPRRASRTETLDRQDRADDAVLPEPRTARPRRDPGSLAYGPSNSPQTQLGRGRPFAIRAEDRSVGWNGLTTRCAKPILTIDGQHLSG